MTLKKKGKKIILIRDSLSAFELLIIDISLAKAAITTQKQTTAAKCKKRKKKEEEFALMKATGGESKCVAPGALANKMPVCILL